MTVLAIGITDVQEDTRTHSPQSVPQVGYRMDTSRSGPTENEILNRQLHCLVPSHMTRTNDQTIQSLSSSRHPQQTIIPFQLHSSTFHLPGQSPHLHSLVPSPNIVPHDDLIAARPFSGGKSSSRTIVDHVPHVPGDAHHTVGSAKHREASKKRRKNAAKFFCPYVESCRDSTFTARHNLEKHLNSHKAPEEKELYACESCPKIYPYKCNLNRHKEKVHSNTKRRKPYEPSQKK
ncbi:hypothetical protein BDN72DRAFT_864316 [Pluteus cervinus]|uniref:Uncharacterized protein n=1 Tax=Pluteus cervinus TaxID=181527 RepID=A0ACD3A492_9AGAR|nr:hypothetical protein BDN72DRAFT_864316 [Pluteus cervinus]